jgi:pullulanase
MYMNRRSTIRYLTLICLILLTLIIIEGLTNFSLTKAAEPIQANSCEQVTLHYRRRNTDYDGWGLHVWGPTPLASSVSWQSPLAPSGQDEFGIYWLIEMDDGAELLNYIIHKGDEKDPGPDQVIIFAESGCEIWQVQGKADQFIDPDTAIEALVVKTAPSPTAGENQATIHYRRVSEDYDGWGLHIWGPTAIEGITWTSPLLPEGQDEYGLYWIIDMQTEADHLNYIVHKGDQKDPGPDQKLDFVELGKEIWLIEGSGEQFTDPESAKQGLLIAGVGDIKNKAQAHWLTRDLIAWPIEFGKKAIYTLYYDPEGNIQVTETGLQGGKTLPLEFIDNTLTSDLAEKYPHLRLSVLLKIPEEYLDIIPDILKGQTAITVQAPDGAILGATALQTPGVLDDLFVNDESLGVIWNGNTPSLQVWAPTAKSVRLHLYEDAEPTTPPETISMKWNPHTGVWFANGEPGWNGKYYLYEVTVFVRQEGKVVTNQVTDPYSIGLAMNSTRSQIIDLNDPTWMPMGWETLQKPVLDSLSDIVIYELHLRDFSIRDQTVPENLRGTYLAFTEHESDGMRHLTQLARAGVTHVHLLPLFDIATINEDKNKWANINYDELASYPPNSDKQQAIVNELRGKDGYNWGYDPFHYSVPEGSYSTDPDGATRIIEFRQMVQALNQAGLRIVMDVVYNHTNASGQSDKSVLDRIVPGYYHRLDENGVVTNSTCCQNTATEHYMMRKLMIDSVLTWVKAYKVDGFRFDLMGHHMKSDMLALRAALDSLTFENDSVDGSKVYVYGEGWDFGEVAENARGINATQLNMGGTGLGTFNDRLRDAVRGGNPFRDPREQGFVTGLYLDPNETNSLSEKYQLTLLLDVKDHIRISLAGNLANFPLVNAQGNRVSGAEISYNGYPAGYTQSPLENIIYVSAHDNETLFDAIQYKASTITTMQDRVRMQCMALSMVAMSQGIPFYHAGSEMLRSKSLDRDSYDSGDWFNALDWTYHDSGWGHGLPLEDKNGNMWEVMTDLLGNEALSPTNDHILTTINCFELWLKIRSSSPLFRLSTAEEVIERVSFHNTDPDQIPGLIVMSIADIPSNRRDENYDLVLVFFNADKEPIQFQLDDLVVGKISLHPFMQDNESAKNADYDSGTELFSIPARTTVVFVRESPVIRQEEKAASTDEPEEIMTPTEDNNPETQATQPATTKAPEESVVSIRGTRIWPWLVGLGIIIGAIGTFLAIRKRGI